MDEHTLRKHGVYYTPKPIVDYAHRMISDTFGENWKEEFIVWDNCAGTCNLTKDYKFRELYISTLFESEVEEGMQYNPEAVHFQFDFLNDDIPNPQALFDTETKLPEGLLDALRKNKKILFLLNPPYIRGGGGNHFQTGDISNIAFTKVNAMMKEEEIGPSSSNLYTQFIYRIYRIKHDFNLSNLFICVICPPKFLTSESCIGLRNVFLNEFHFERGFFLKADMFENVSGSRSFSCTLWSSGVTENKDDFIIDCCVFDKSGEVHTVRLKMIYNLDNREACKEWVVEPVKDLKTYEVPRFTSGIKVKHTGNNKSRMTKNALGYFNCNSNSVNGSPQTTSFFSSGYSEPRGFSITEANYERCCVYFATRALTNETWINSQDEYMKPNLSDPRFLEFMNDSIVLSLFHSKSHQSSLQGIIYKDKKWDIKNEFFWQSKQHMKELGKYYGNDICFDTAVAADDERFVYRKLQTLTLSAEAQAVLDYANILLDKSFEKRLDFDKLHPEYQINNFDCGYYQLKALWKEYYQDEFKEFRSTCKILAEKMRPMIYELGFLYK